MLNRFIAGFVLASITLVSAPMLVLTHASPASPHGPAAHDHSCCPRIYPKIEFVLASVAPSNMPCGDEHACCVKPAQNPPSLPVGKQVTSSRAEGTGEKIAGVERDSSSTSLTKPLGRDPFDFYSIRNTVLRI